MRAQIAITKVYEVELCNGGGPRPRTVSEAEQHAAGLSREQIEGSGRVISVASGKPSIVTPAQRAEGPCTD